MAKTLVVAGYYGFGNWGDEATLSVLLRYLKRSLPQVRIVVLSHDPAATERGHAVSAVNRWNPLAVRDVLQDAAAFILGPGSLLQDQSSTRSLLYYLGLLYGARRMRKPVYLLGQGIGPLRSARAQRWVARSLQAARLILLRDRASYAWACRQKLTEDRIILGEDLALLLDYPSDSRPLAQREREDELLRLGLALRPGLSPRNLQELCQSLTALGDRLPVNRWVLLPFHPAQDEPVLQMVARALGDNVSLVRAESSLHLLQEMQNLDALIGMRLHSLVFALLTGTPFYGLSYDPKIESFIERIERSAQSLLYWSRVGEDLEHSSLTAQIERVCKERERLRAVLARARQILQASAQAALERAMSKLAEDIELL